MKSNRRQFFKKGGLGLTALAASPLLAARHKTEGEVTAPRKISYELAIAGYTFARFNMEDSLKMMQRVGVQHLCIKDFHLPLDASEKQIEDFHNQCAEYGVKGYAVGPIYMRSEKEVNDAFEYAKKTGVKMIVGVPNYDLLPLVDKKVREYEMQYAIHNHGPGDKLYPTPEVIYEKVKDLDRRIGICHDVGHTKRYGRDPVAMTLKYGDRIYDMHIKDVTAGSTHGRSCELGRGVLDFAALFDAVAHTGYSGMCSIEHEKDMGDPLAGIAECVGYYNAVQDMI